MLCSDIRVIWGNMPAAYDFENWFYTMLSSDSVSIGLLWPRAVVHSEGARGENRLFMVSIPFIGLDFLASIRESLSDWFFILGVMSPLSFPRSF